MKKLLSIIMSICMLLTLVAVPVNVVAAEDTVAYEDTTLGSYYKFTFGEDEFYNYTIDGTETYKNNTFKPLHVQSDKDAKVGYKEVTDSVTGEKYDTLEIVNGANITFTPVTKEGQPFELTPGKEYVIKVQYFNPLSNCWVHQFVSVGQNFAEGQTAGVWGKYIDVSDGSYLNTSYCYGTASSISNQGGSGWHYAVKDGTYGKTSKLTDYNEGACLHTLDERFGLTCTHTNTAHNSKSPYIAQERSLTLPADHFTYDEENMSYSADRVIYTQNATTKEYEATGDSLSVNNYLSLYLGGGNVAQYSTSNYPLYGNYTYDDFYDAEDTRQNVYTSYQIESIEIYEAGVGTVNYHVGDTVTTVVGATGDAVDITPPAVPADKDYFVNWYTDEDYTTPITEAPTIAESTALELYAKFADYGDYLKLDFESGSHPATAVQYTAEGGFYYPLIGYSYKTKYTGVTVDASKTPVWTKDDLINDLTRKGISTEYPASAISFYSDRTWGMPGGVFLVNPDGTLFVPEAGATYKVTYRYRAPIHNGQNIGINVAYGIPDALMNTSSSGDKACYSTRLAWNSVSAANIEWTTVSETVTIPADNSTSVPALGLEIGGAKKVAVDTDEDGTADAYEFTVVDLDYIEVEKIPTATVNYLNADGSVHTAAKTLEVGAEITYPTLTASLNYDYIWSLSATEYKEVPKTVASEEDITVYALQNPVRSFENYPVYTADENNLANYSPALPYDNELNTQVTTEDAYTGTHSMKLRDHYIQIQTSEPTDWATAWNTKYYEFNEESGKWVKLTGDEAPTFEANKYGMWRNAVETGMTVIQQFPKCDSISFSYKVSFKYKATANNTEASTLSARLFPYANIWWGYENIDGSFTFPAGATDGWQTGEMYVNVSDYTQLSNGKYSTTGTVYVLDLKWDGKGTQYNNEIYIDDIVIEEVETATFNILVDGATVEGEGNYDSENGVFTAYGNGATLKAPTVIAESGAKIETWYTDEACTVEATSIVAGGVYYGTIEYVEFVAFDGSSTKVYYNDGDVIEYPEIAASRNYDSYWSLKADAYEAVPENFDGTVTVYAVKTDVIGFSNYSGHAYSSDTNLTITDELEAGNNVVKVQDNDYTLLTGDKALAEVTTGTGEEAVTTTAWLTPGNTYYWATRYMLDENGEWILVGDVYDEAPEFEEGKYYSNRNNYRDHAISLWSLELGKTYKVTFKYYIPEQLSEEFRVAPITSSSNIWAAGQAVTYDPYVINTDTKTGEWIEGEVYFTNTANEGFSMLYIALYQNGLETKDIAYFDDFALAEAEIVTFAIPEGAVLESEGEVVDGILTLYVEKGGVATAPVVIDADGNPIDAWCDEDGNVVTVFTAGAYTAYTAPKFIYGDCNDDGDINTTDLAALKLYLAGSGEVGFGGDCNGDGDINTTDLAALKLFLAGSGVLGPQA